MNEPTTSPDQEAAPAPSDPQPTAADMFSQIDWDARLKAAVEATLTARLRKRQERTDHLERRRHGKAAYHAAKLKRAQQGDPR